MPSPFFDRLKLRSKLLLLVLPLVIIPIIVVALVTGFIANQKAYLGITQTSKDDLQHMAEFTIDLLRSYDKQFQDYRFDITGDLETELASASFANLKDKIKNKRVGKTGYIYCMDRKGTLTIHRESEGKNIIDATDSNGHPFIREMIEHKSGWIRYPWQNEGDAKPRMKIVRYEYFPVWDWIVAVGSYEDEFYKEANAIKSRIFWSTIILIGIVGCFATLLVVCASNVATRPINQMIETIRKVRKGDMKARMAVSGSDELAEMATAFNRMTDIIQRNQEMEASLAQQGKMASLGVLSSGVAHEINNPLGVILGYAGYLEGKLSEDDPNYKYIHEIKRESKRCKKIVQDLLSYARTPRPTLVLTNLNELLTEIVEFSANHTDMRGVTIRTSFDRNLPPVLLDGDQLRQVAINLILNAGGAMPDGGELLVATTPGPDDTVRVIFRDTGSGIPQESLEKIFEPFYTTKARGTGLGLAITRQIIEMHHGSITIESEPGHGTTVTVTLPLDYEELA
ncbi:MAG: Cache 3/Cache 2 fusion domain-containing protein [Geobacter sp.]|uniref:Cache 3/Cache 2 fusion domain-containing protein n=1 Tax=Trichlorobacter sp. TaxID=2911007 RepID=UPI002A36CCA0|nr:Cache 3/Cache 2 fusion domain-containing protein [Trichlorobacter sp.]MDY0384713.1 Cache 3/Cache 2 fusion domain-containing protein [Trichlorobacter sp.]